MTDAELQALLRERAVEQVEPDVTTAEQELAAARAHLESAGLIVERDPTGAFAIGYDAMRKAVSAHMRARGYRVTKGPGHHYRTVRYALAALDHAGVEDHVEAFDELRQLRNQSEYEALMIEPDEVGDLLAHARALIDAIGEELACE